MFKQILKYAGLLATIAVVALVTRLAKKALAQAERESGALNSGLNPSEAR